MATRGMIGIVDDNKLIMSYNHYDSQPHYLGKALNKFYDTPDEAYKVATAGDIRFIDDTTGGIELLNNPKPPITININAKDPEMTALEVARAIDNVGADYAYIYNYDESLWQAFKNNGIRAMAEEIEKILFDGIDRIDDEEEYFYKSLEDKPLDEEIVHRWKYRAGIIK
jgi:hypothetical protein